MNIHSVLSLSLHLSRRSIGLKNTMLSTCRILCSFDLMSPRPIILSDGREAPFYLVIQHFEQFLNIKLGNPGDIKRRVLERKKDRTKFTEAIFHTLNNEDE